MQASVISFAELLSGGNSTELPVFANITSSSVVFGPETTLDEYGTEDPRLTYDPVTELYYMFYTSYGPNNVVLSLATSPNPTNPDEWTRYGALFPTIQNSKAGALIIRETAPNYLIWGSGTLYITNSTSLTYWPEPGDVILEPRNDYFDSILLESGPNPVLLSTGDYLFLYNSENPDGFYTGWVVLNGTDPTQVVARSIYPLLSPDFLWEQGFDPWTCNVQNVIFVNSIVPTETVDVFRVYFGGASAVVGSAVIQVTF